LSLNSGIEWILRISFVFFSSSVSWLFLSRLVSQFLMTRSTLLQASILARKYETEIGIAWVLFSWMFGTSRSYRIFHQPIHHGALEYYCLWSTYGHSIFLEFRSLTVLMLWLSSRSGSSLCQSSRSFQSPDRRFWKNICPMSPSVKIKPPIPF